MGLSQLANLPVRSEPSDLTVRPYTDADLDTFKRIHAESGLDYKFPNLSSPLFIVKTVVERAGKPVLLAAGKLQVETYLMVEGGPEAKWEAIQTAQPHYLNAVWKRGLDSTFCVVPPEVDAYFAKRMIALGWTPARSWFPWTRETGIITP